MRVLSYHLIQVPCFSYSARQKKKKICLIKLRKKTITTLFNKGQIKNTHLEKNGKFYEFETSGFDLQFYPRIKHYLRKGNFKENEYYPGQKCVRGKRKTYFPIISRIF